MVKINAAARILASKDAELAAYVNSLSEKQKWFFLLSFPNMISDWFSNSFNRTGLKKVNPHLTLAAIDASDFEMFVTIWAALRQLYPPTTSAGRAIYRITSVHQMPETKEVRFTNKTQLKAATSWSLNPNPEVKGRKGKKGLGDIVLSTKLKGSGHVLFDWDSCTTVCNAVYRCLRSGLITEPPQSGERYYNIGSFWAGTIKHQLKFAHEREVVVYLNEGEALTCTWTTPK